ncbi:MAG: nucleotidyltransferase family protein [Bacteroidia bacterium]|nr:nucleotidyltransferase family protein [Bacteroidia bacterium]
MVLTKDIILQLLKKQHLKLTSLGVKRIGLFGSFSRNEEREDSDIDLLVEFQPEAEKFDNLMALGFFLNDLFPGRKVEIATVRGLSPYIGTKIIQEVIYAQIAA